MLRRRRSTVGAVLALGCLVAAGCADGDPRAGESAASSSAGTDEPYDYPSLSPATRADPQTAIEHLQVPDEELAGMSTEALVKTVLSFPYAGNLLAFNTAQEAVQNVGQQCNALSELLGRADMADQVETVLGQVQRGEFTVDDASAEMLVMYLKVLANPESSEPLPGVLG